MSHRSEYEKKNRKRNAGKLLAAGILVLLTGFCVVSQEKRIARAPSLSAGQAAEETAFTAPAEREVPELITQGEAHWGLYCYECLTEEEKCWYVEMYDILNRMLEEGELSVDWGEQVEEARLDKVFQCVMNDHPELFFVRGYTYTRYTYAGEIAGLGFAGLYTMSPEEREEKQKLIEAQAETYLKGIASDASDYNKVKYVYDTIVMETEYRKDAEESQNIYSVLVNHESVCQGYAKAAQYLLERLGVDSTLVKGTVNGGEGHAWNLVWVDGESYYMDPTWGDASYRTEEGGEGAVSYQPAVNYDYFCVTTEQLSRTHVIDNVVPLPECAAMAANYYIREGAYFTEYEETAVEDFFERGIDAGRTELTLKCADEEVYADFNAHLVDEQEIFDYLNANGGSVAYTEDPLQLSMTFWLVEQ